MKKAITFLLCTYLSWLTSSFIHSPKHQQCSIQAPVHITLPSSATAAGPTYAKANKAPLLRNDSTGSSFCKEFENRKPTKYKNVVLIIAVLLESTQMIWQKLQLVHIVSVKKKSLSEIFFVIHTVPIVKCISKQPQKHLQQIIYFLYITYTIVNVSIQLHILISPVNKCII